MSEFVLRFIQEYPVADRAAFMELETRFAEMERRRPDWPRGRRLQAYAAGQATNALIWEATFPTLTDALAALDRIAADAEHEELFHQQAPLITRARTEIYETLEL